MERVTIRKHFTRQQATDTHINEGTQAPRVSRARRGSSKQSQVQDNSCASVATMVKPSKASRRARHDESAQEDGNQKSTERESNRNFPKNGPEACGQSAMCPGRPKPIMNTNSRAGDHPTNHGHPQPTEAGHDRLPVSQEAAVGGMRPSCVLGNRSQP